MAVSIRDDYLPGTANGNTCYACGAGRRDVRDPDGMLRKERVVDLEQQIDYEGYLMLCETCVRDAAGQLGMVAADELAKLFDTGRALVALAELQRDEAYAERDAALAALTEANNAVRVVTEFIRDDKPKASPQRTKSA